MLIIDFANKTADRRDTVIAFFVPVHSILSDNSAHPSPKRLVESFQKKKNDISKLLKNFRIMTVFSMLDYAGLR